mmetsp:Transcript_7889/g.11701  ORF Transcript_7889/g.11701 Transcript_7889/m.11701 type:complete len:342 (+) Transcript_7889:100-1125(+)
MNRYITKRIINARLITKETKETRNYVRREIYDPEKKVKLDYTDRSLRGRAYKKQYIGKLLLVRRRAKRFNKNKRKEFIKYHARVNKKRILITREPEDEFDKAYIDIHNTIIGSHKAIIQKHNGKITALPMGELAEKLVDIVDEVKEEKHFDKLMTLARMTYQRGLNYDPAFSQGLLKIMKEYNENEMAIQFIAGAPNMDQPITVEQVYHTLDRYVESENVDKELLEKHLPTIFDNILNAAYEPERTPKREDYAKMMGYAKNTSVALNLLQSYPKLEMHQILFEKENQLGQQGHLLETYMSALEATVEDTEAANTILNEMACYYPEESEPFKKALDLFAKEA